jgi:sugar-specific transcriptional regulator TrmB
VVISSIGQVSNIYNSILKAFAEFIKLLQYLFAFLKLEDAKQQPSSAPDTVIVNAGEEPSILWIILEKIVYAIILVIIAAILGYAIYALTKWFIKVIKRFLNWLKNKEQYTLRVYENGHVDEKESLYNKNLKRLAKKISKATKSLFEKEIPYNKLPDEKAKVRRLFKYFLNGVSINISSTAEEICSQASGISPETNEFNNLMSRNYNGARYGDLAPSRQDLEQLESKLLK